MVHWQSRAAPPALECALTAGLLRRSGFLSGSPEAAALSRLAASQHLHVKLWGGKYQRETIVCKWIVYLESMVLEAGNKG